MCGRRLSIAAALLIAASLAAACGGGGATEPPGGGPSSPTAVATPTIGLAATATAASVVIDPCTTRTSLDGRALTPGVSFGLDASTKWQFCDGGAAAGSSEKFLFRTGDGGHTWTLISRTTLGNPPPEPGVGALPNQNGVTQLLFVDATYGWMGLNSPGRNLYRTTDGGLTWAAASELPPTVPVTSIVFTNSTHGTVVTANATWTTSDGGDHWKKTTS